MRNLAALVVMTGLFVSGFSQVKAPQPSPKAKIEQVIGLTDVTVEYSRPGMKDRKIFGDLVPYNELWRTGANENTIITFSDDVKIEGKELPKGSYALFTKPGEKTWDVIFYSDTKNWGTPGKWDESKVAVKATVTAQKMPVKIESFLIVFDMLDNNGAEMELLWENTYVPIQIEVPTDKTTQASIDAAFSGPSAQDYYSAAAYYLAEGKDLKKALEWAGKAVTMRGEDAYWMLRTKSLIEAKMGDKKAAVASAKRSLASAEKAGNQGYVKLNKNSIAEWGS